MGGEGLPERLRRHGGLQHLLDVRLQGRLQDFNGLQLVAGDQESYIGIRCGAVAGAAAEAAEQDQFEGLPTGQSAAAPQHPVVAPGAEILKPLQMVRIRSHPLLARNDATAPRTMTGSNLRKR